MLAQQGQQVRPDACEDGRAGRQHAVCERNDRNDHLTTSTHSSPTAKMEHFESKLPDTMKGVFTQQLEVRDTRGA